MKKITLPILYGAAILLLCACATQHAEKVVRLNDADDIKVTDLRSTPINGLLNVSATLQNQSSSTENFQYRFHWITNSGFAAADDEAWRPQMVYGNQSVQVRGTAPNPTATDFNLELSE